MRGIYFRNDGMFSQHSIRPTALFIQLDIFAYFVIPQHVILQQLLDCIGFERGGLKII